MVIKVQDTLKLLRPHQWLKNILVFVPLIAAHTIDLHKWIYAIGAFVVFCLCASAVYIFNDIVDLENDRKHPTKKFRPLAANKLSRKYALVILSILLFLALFLALIISPMLIVVMLIYVAINLGYSFYFKKLIFIDVIILACLYAIRILAGGVVTGIILSDWLIAFSFFLFLSLAIAKRVIELNIIKNQAISFGRNYIASDEQVMKLFGIASSCVSVLVLVLYVHQIKDMQIYRFADLLWFMCVLLFYWLGRLWLLIERGLVHDDPILFITKDKASYYVIFLSVVCYLIAVL